MPHTARINLSISGMTCGACVARVEKVLNRLPGVQAQVNLATESARIDVNDASTSLEKIKQTILAAGYGVAEQRIDSSVQERQELRLFWIAAALSAPFLLQMGAMLTGGTHEFLPAWLQWALATPVQFWIGWRYYTGAWRALRGGSANMDVLVALGTSAAYFYSVAAMLMPSHSHHLYFEASVAIITLVMLGKILESRARHRTKAALQGLAKLLPNLAHVERAGHLHDVDVAQVAVGDIIVIRAHERAPVDAQVQDGESEMDESLISGESAWIPKTKGALIYAGSRNAQSQLRCRATRVGAHTHLAEIGRMVEEAQASKAPVQRMADRIAGVFVPIIVGLALITFGAWWWLGGSFEPALVNAIAVLVIACPCALGLATPTAVVVGMGRGAQFSILMRHAQALEAAGRIDTLIVDKTGTLTEGRPSVTRMLAAVDVTPTQAMRIAASIESGSDHPIALAIREFASRAEVVAEVPTQLRSVPGQGLHAQVAGRTYVMGSPVYVSGLGIRNDVDGMKALEETGNTLVVLADEERVMACFAIADSIRPTSADAVRKLKAMGIELIMLTGDHPRVAARVAAALELQNYQAQVLPRDKAQAVTRLQAQGRRVGMAGDGVNDAPALASADVSFAMGAGTDLAIESADVTLMRNDLLGAVNAIALSRASLRVIRQNLFFALIYNLLGVPLAALGMLNPIIAGAAMAMSSVCVVGNSLRLRHWKPPA